jgi:hypothetical protein
VWGFDAAGSYGYILDGHWKSLLDSKGADNITKVAGLYSEIDWDKLEPDFDEKFILPVSSSDAGKITTALANDGTFGIAYFPESRSATLDLTRITVGKKVKAQWFDPTSGEYAEVTGSPFKKENRSFTTPGNNSDGDPDWVLIVSSD